MTLLQARSEAWAAQPCVLLSVDRLVSAMPTHLMPACRAMEFVASLLRRLEADKDVTLSAAANDAYAETLHRFHGWMTSAAFYVALKVREAGQLDSVMLPRQPGSCWPVLTLLPQLVSMPRHMQPVATSMDCFSRSLQTL